MDDLIAHSANQSGRQQSLLEHLGNVAHLAERFARPFQSERFAEWLGWWHDAGKVAPDVQKYLRGEGPSKDHSSAGMLAAEPLLPPLAFNVAGHHGGLSNKIDLRDRIAKKQRKARVTNALKQAEVLLADLAPSLDPKAVPEFLKHDQPEVERRRWAFWIRMLHSALVDADCLDTEAHFRPDKAALRKVETRLVDLWPRFEQSQRALMQDKTSVVNTARREIYEACLACADESPGIFSLTVPTGGGKTRSAMGFALQHALRHGKRRVIVALPYTSIIEQNADVYRKLFEDEIDDAPQVVLEHHSAVAGRERAGEETDAERWTRLAADNWDAPIIVTTTVQLLESLFANRSSRCRKLHNLVNSVLVLDEVQTLPPYLLRPTLEALEHLVEAYGVTLLLCTATQPALKARDRFPGLSNVREIVRDPASVFYQLRRVRYEINVGETWSWQRVADTLFSADQAMVVLNTIGDAMNLLDEIGDPDVLHLSALLCGAHRRVVLADVHRRLDEERPIHLVSTQVVEAGVNLDFPLVMRALGPLDRIIQAAGRCNREGDLDAGRVVIFEPEDGHLPPGAYKTGTSITRTLLATNPLPDLDDPDLPLKYFRMLYDALRESLDERDILGKWTRFEFEKVAHAYRLIDDDTIPVVVPYDAPGHDGKREAVLDRIRWRGKPFRDDFRALQPYLVNLRARVHEQAVQRGLCEECAPGVWIWRGDYDERRGLQMDIPFLKDPVI